MLANNSAPTEFGLYRRQGSGASIEFGMQETLESIDPMISMLEEAERRITESNAAVERQRQLIEKLAHHGDDITSAQIVFDSLLVTLSLHLQDRHRLRGSLNGAAAKQNCA